MMRHQKIQRANSEGTGSSRNYYYYGENYLLEYFSDTISNSPVVATKEARDIYNKGVSANPNDL